MWQEIATAWRQDATYHQGTRWLFNFTPPVAKTSVSVEHHNGSYAGGADVLVRRVGGCKKGGGQDGTGTRGRECACARARARAHTVAVHCPQNSVTQSSTRLAKDRTNKHHHLGVLSTGLIKKDGRVDQRRTRRTKVQLWRRPRRAAFCSAERRRGRYYWEANCFLKSFPLSAVMNLSFGLQPRGLSV